MKLPHYFFLMLLLPVNLLAQIDPYLPDPTPPANLPGYKLIWSDEFNETGKPSGSNWSYENGFVRNEEHQWYQSDNASMANGSLRLTGRRETFKNPNYVSGSSDWKKSREYVNYTSASIHTRGKKSFKYGRFEIRAKIPAVTGAWPAIWTLGDWGDWPTNGEIDIMEYYGDGILANAAWGSATQWQGVWDSSKKPMSYFKGKDSDWANKYHIWVMDWTPEFIKIYLDGELLNTIETAKTKNNDGSNPFTSRNHHILLNLALGGVNGGDPSKPNYPITYYVDYVRVYQPDASYAIPFVPLNAGANLAPDPECNSAIPDGEGERLRNRNPMRVLSGTYCAEVRTGKYLQRVNWLPEKQYRVRAMINCADTGVVVGINGLGPDADVIHRVGFAPGQWQLVDFSFTTPATAGEGGGVVFSGPAGTLIDNVEVYELNQPYHQISHSALHFNSAVNSLVFRVTSNGQSGNVLLSAPTGITLSQQLVTPAEASLGAYVTATYTSGVLTGQPIRILSSTGTTEVAVYAQPARPTSSNLIEYWDADGASGAGSEPDKAGWMANGSVAWKTANAPADVRYSDQTTAGSYTFNGAAWGGRVLHLRWDGTLSPEKYYAYPVDLYKGRYYTVGGKYAWQANGGEYAVYSIGVNSAPDNSGFSVYNNHRTIFKADKYSLFDFRQVFSVPEDGRYYLTFTNTSTIMGGIADLEIKEGIRLPVELTVLPNNLSFSQSATTRTIALTGKYIHNDIVLTAPEGVRISRSVVTSDEINSGVVTLTVSFDGSRDISGETIELKCGELQRSIPVTATGFPTGLRNPDLHSIVALFTKGQLQVRSLNSEVQLHTVELFTVQGECIWKQNSVESDFHSEQIFRSGTYILRIKTSNGLLVRKLVNISI